MQTTFFELEYASKNQQAKRDRFLTDIQAATPWVNLVAVIEPYHPKGEGQGRSAIGLEGIPGAGLLRSLGRGHRGHPVRQTGHLALGGHRSGP